MFCSLFLTWGQGTSIPYSFQSEEGDSRNALGCYENEDRLKRRPNAQGTSTIVLSMAFLLLIKGLRFRSA